MERRRALSLIRMCPVAPPRGRPLLIQLLLAITGNRCRPANRDNSHVRREMTSSPHDNINTVDHSLDQPARPLYLSPERDMFYEASIFILLHLLLPAFLAHGSCTADTMPFTRLVSTCRVTRTSYP